MILFLFKLQGVLRSIPLEVGVDDKIVKQQEARADLGSALGGSSTTIHTYIYIRVEGGRIL